jgi:hypothetical protein
MELLYQLCHAHAGLNLCNHTGMVKNGELSMFCTAVFQPCLVLNSVQFAVMYSQSNCGAHVGTVSSCACVFVVFVLSLQEVHEAVAARLVELEEAMNAELSQLAAAGQAQLAALNRSLGDKMGGIAQLKAQFEERLNAAWEEYGETYAQLASVQEVRGVLGLKGLSSSSNPKGGGMNRRMRSWQACMIRGVCC